MRTMRIVSSNPPNDRVGCAFLHSLSQVYDFCGWLALLLLFLHAETSINQEAETKHHDFMAF